MRFSLSDTLVTFTVAVLSVFLLVVFFNDLNAISSRGNETPLGTIFFKKQTATRKSSDSQIWERLRNQSPVYAADTLRTDEDSEAVVNFDDGLSLDMLQNSMLKLTTHGTSRNLDFQEGSITLQGGGKGGAVMLGQNGRSVTLSDDAQLVVTKTKDTTSLELSQGTAQISDANGQQQTLNPEMALDLNDQTGAAVVRVVDLIPQSPVQGARLLTVESGKVPVKFTWSLSSAKVTNVELQLSPSEDFGSPTVYPVRDKQAEVPLEPGVWYWRLASGDSHSSTRQLTLSHDDPLTPIQPQEGADLAYRKKLPPVRFSWTASDHVVYWDLELALGKPDFQAPALKRRLTVSSLSLDGLKAGDWYWRVIPHYSGTLLSTQKAPAVGHFTIVQKAQMAALSPTLPVEGTLVQTQEISTKGLAFTWDPPAEAKHYELAAYRSPNASGTPVARFETESPYRIVTPQELGALATPGKSYWVVRWFDDEGNASAGASPRGVQAFDSSLALRPTFPADGYRVADRFVTNVRFSWKSNLPTKTVFQVSRTADFQDLAFEEPVKSDTLLGRNWPIGTYYWRLSSFNVNGSVFLQTPPRRFDVVPPFPEVRLVQPVPGTEVLLPEGVDSDVSWPALKEADYYEFTLFETGVDGTLGRTAYRTVVEASPGPEDVTLTLPLSKLTEANYQARIQAFAREKASSTNVIGLYGDSRFAYKRLRSIELGSPDDNSQIDGLTAHRHGVTLEWNTVNLPPDAVVTLTRLPDGAEVVRSPVKEVAPVRVPRLGAGEYSWTVEGTVAGFDVSARSPHRFVVLPIPPLPAAQGLDPPDRVTYGPPELRKMKGIDFRWESVPGAQEYLFSLYEDNGLLDNPGTPVLQLQTAQPQASLAKMALLHRGSYFWVVQGRTRDAAGDVEQEGVPVRHHFVINLPELSKPKLPTGQAYYGR